MNTSRTRYAATVGTFDGVHRGHTEVLDTLGFEAVIRGLQPLAITFDRHPLSVIAPERAPGMLTQRHERDLLIRSHRVKPVEIPFTSQLASMTAREWIQCLHNDYNVDLLVIGYDNTFGHDGRSLTHNDYLKIGKEAGIEIIEAPCLPGISSSAIRHAVTEGRITEASDMLGRPFALEGTVGTGQQVGRTIGFPTANVVQPSYMAVPGGGVYAARAFIPDRSDPIAAMVNIGRRPTIADSLGVTVEANLIDWSGDLYGLPLRLEFLQRLRDERRFDSLDSLAERLRKDRIQARELFLAAESAK
ncbi:MAG: riboflavin biosynthesis protein RibF [Muribaculaceae bacterium]|nr:riboflavin biosynthesis protein RibF [Muribaculaceae bacterium]